MKRIILSLSVIFLFAASYGQITYHGTVVKKFNGAVPGDTVIVYGPLAYGDETFFKNYNNN